jgi:hypothetical protein
MAEHLNRSPAGTARAILDQMDLPFPAHLTLYLSSEREPDHVIVCHAEPASNGRTRWVPSEDVLIKAGETAVFELRDA